MRGCAVVICACLPLVLQAAFTPPQAQLMPLRLTSCVAQQEHTLIESPLQWERFWQAQSQPRPKVPLIDFQHEKIIAVFSGPRSVAGYDLRLLEHAYQPGKFQVRYQELPLPRDQFLPVQPSATCLLIRLAGIDPATGVEALRLESPHALAMKEFVPMRSLSRVSNSLITDPRFVIARDPASFRQLWKEHHGSLEQLPEVDFSREMVAAVFLGERSTGGYTVTIEQAVEQNGKLLLSYVEAVPPEGSMIIQMLTAPAHLVALPQSDGLPEFSLHKP
jgi:hypothetical protein